MNGGSAFLGGNYHGVHLLTFGHKTSGNLRCRKGAHDYPAPFRTPRERVQTARLPNRPGLANGISCGRGTSENQTEDDRNLEDSWVLQRPGFDPAIQNVCLGIDWVPPRNLLSRCLNTVRQNRWSAASIPPGNRTHRRTGVHRSSFCTSKS